MFEFHRDGIINYNVQYAAACMTRCTLHFCSERSQQLPVVYGFVFYVLLSANTLPSHLLLCAVDVLALRFVHRKCLRIPTARVSPFADLHHAFEDLRVLCAPAVLCNISCTPCIVPNAYRFLTAVTIYDIINYYVCREG